MRYDVNLNPVLEKASNEELQFLVDIITKSITNSLECNDFYKAQFPDHKKYINLIASEIRSFGGNTFANTFRGEGPEYKEVVCDVAKRLKINYDDESDIEDIEHIVLEHILKSALEKLNEDEKKELLKELGASNITSFNGQALTFVLLRLFRTNAFAAFQMSLVITNIILKQVLGRGLAVGVTAGMAKVASVLTGPIGWIITAVWTAVDIAGPAYRVTIPAVIYVAMLRKKYYTPTCPHCKQMISEGVKFCPECGTKIQATEE